MESENTDFLSEKYIEITPEFAYLTIPADYICIYHKLLVYMADFGKTIVDDCDAACKGNGKHIITCWNLFQSAIACRTLGREKEAEFFINYIETQLESTYKYSDSDVYQGAIPVSISEDGHIKAVVTCGEESHFYVDVDTGKLYETYKKDVTTKRIYGVIDGNLIVKS